VASTLTRRPLPALVSLLALLLLTGLVWFRVLHRGDAKSTARPCPTPTQSAAVSTLPGPAKVTLEILNATTRSGIAARARTTLVDAGFLVPKTAGNDRKAKINKIAATAEIRYGPTGQQAAKTSLTYEYPAAEGDPYYPIPREENREQYNLYLKEAEKLNGSVLLAGRLADYKYYNMDQAVARALKLFEESVVP